jgi:hypothetical protein
MLRQTFTSEKTRTVKLSDSVNGFNIWITQDKDHVEMSIDQAAAVAVQILNHVGEMRDKHLKKL